MHLNVICVVSLFVWRLKRLCTQMGRVLKRFSSSTVYLIQREFSQVDSFVVENADVCKSLSKKKKKRMILNESRSFEFRYNKHQRVVC